jgi:TonB-linked SusC/RagA family outer membrane protein
MPYAKCVVRGLLSCGAAALLLVGTAASAQGQTGSIRGAVRDAVSQRPIEDAEVSVVGLQMRTTSDEAGAFVLNNVPIGQQRVQVRVLGYSSQIATTSVTAAGPNQLDFALRQSVVALDAVVVTGTGAQVEKKQLGNTIGTIDAERLENAPVLDFSEQIAARDPSLAVLPSSGLAGAGARIRIRGTNSLAMSNEPVVYMDGVRIDNSGGFDGGVPSEAGGASKLDDINPAAVDRIEVLKGAAAATLYGSEASAGVIQIFTKRGRQGAPRFSFRIEQGLSQYPDVFKPNAGFARFATYGECEVFDGDGDGEPDFSPTVCRTSAPVAEKVNALYDLNVQPYEVFEREFVNDMLETGHHQVYNASVTGGGGDVNYFVAGRFSRLDGPFGGTELGPARDFNRKIQGNFNVSIFPRERLSFRVGGMFTDTRHETPNNGNNIFGVIPLAMFGKPEVAWCDDADGDGTQDASGTVGNTTPLCEVSGNPTGQVAFATVRESMQQETVQDAEHFNGNFTATYQAAQSLNVEGTFGLDATNGRSFEFAPFGYALDNFTGNNVDGFRSIGTRNHREVTVDLKGIWSARSGDISSTFTAGGQGFISTTKVSGGFGSAFPGPGLEVAGAAANQTLSEFFSEKVNLGLFGQEQVGLNDWVFLTVGGRWDRNSAFGANTGGAFYPKASISIIPSDLSSWVSRSISTLRVRAAVGKSGLQPGAFDRLTTFGAAPTSEGAGLQPDNLGNADLAPEKATEWEVGAELGLFDDRAAVDVTYWKRVTKDAMILRQFPVTGGFQNFQLVNIGELTGKGVELKLDWLAMDREDVSLSFFGTTSYLDEIVTSMGVAPPIKVGGSYPRYRNFIIEDYAPGSFFGAELVDYTPGQTVPFDTNDDGEPDTEAEFRAFLTSIPSHNLDGAALSPMMRDDDGDGDLLDHYQGKPTPDWQGAFGTSVTLWRNLQVNSVFEYKTGDYTVSNLTDAFRQANPAIGRNYREPAEVEATLANPATQTDEQARFDAAMEWATELKALSPYDGLNQAENAKFLRWRELSLTYTTPPEFAGRFGMDNLQITLSGRNLKMWTGYTGIDQEMNALSRCGGGGEASRDCNFLDGVDAFGLPLPRRYTLAVAFGF